MFSFGTRDDSQRNAHLKYANYRMEILKHNPYIGTFHGKPILSSVNETTASTDVIEDSKRNPMIGLFRHSPSLAAKSLGLKAVIYNDQSATSTVVSQLTALNRETTKPKETLSKRNFVSSLKQIPVTVFSASSAASRSGSEKETSNPRLSTSNNEESGPLCAICLEAYTDGDEILTLACSHCFHSDCVSKWFFQGCLNNTDVGKAFNCPECRQDHIALSEHESKSSSSENIGGIPSRSFLQMGQHLFVDGGYDFLSDAGSDQMVASSMAMAMANSVQRLKLTTPSPEPKGVLVTLQQQRLTPVRPPSRPLSRAAIMSPARSIVMVGGDEEEETASAHPTPHGAGLLDWSAYSDCGFPLTK